MKSEQNYSYYLPKNLIAQTPARPRDHAKLLVYSLRDGSLTDSYFYELPNFINIHTTLVVNDSKVGNCRWLFDDNKIEVFVLDKRDPYTVRALIRPGRKFKVGSTVNLTEWLTAEVLHIDSDGIRTIRLNVPHDDNRIKTYEHIPLPPYIVQNDELAPEYQTVYAQDPGSLAAPTAGLHFTDELLAKIATKHEVSKLTLHVGLGTFANLTDENLKTGRLHAERIELDLRTAEQLNNARHITAVGTTSVRTLESIADKYGKFKATHDETDIFIRPGYKFKAVDSMITNFHLPDTSLMMLVAAFLADKQATSETEAIGELKRIYQHAIDKSYRFYSFGDAMILV